MKPVQDKRLIVAIVMPLFLLATGMGIGQETGSEGKGRETFAMNCSPCHPQGGNLIKPEKTIKGSKKLTNPKALLEWIRKSVASMPVFPAARISDKQAEELYLYIVMAAKNEWK